MSHDRFSDQDYERLARYFAGEGSPVERSEFERWVAASPGRQVQVDAMSAGWMAARSPQTWNVDSAWREFAGRLENATLTGDDSSTVVSISSRRQWWQDSARVMKLAAGVVLIVGAAITWPLVRPGMTGANSAVASSAAPVSTIAGERRTINLPDGSRVVLGVSSSLVPRAGYGDGSRQVDLVGEALFVVTHDAKRPFRVHIGNTIVEDLGTEFTVRAYGADSSVRVAVSSGSVTVRRGMSGAPAAVLAPRDVAFVEDTGEVRVSRGVDVSTYSAWTEGRLIFSDTPLAQVAQELERWYGVQVRITDKALLERHVTATFEAESLNEILRVIGLMLDARYLRTGNVIEFTGSGAAIGAPRPAATRTEAGV
jgi:transmembrane sensor